MTTTSSRLAFTPSVLIGLVLCLRIYPALSLPINGDEGSDLFIIQRDLSTWTDFFIGATSSFALDQARLPHVIAALVMGAAGIDAHNAFDRIGILRLAFFLFHVAYLIVSYRIIKAIEGDRTVAWLYVIALTTSCYLASYSIAAMTTGEAVYLLFHILSISIFYTNSRPVIEGTGEFGQFSSLTLVLAACIAGKLFGVFLLVAFFLFHLVHFDRVRSIPVASIGPRNLLFLSGAFFSLIATINLIPIPAHLKTISGVSAGLAYLIIWILIVLRERRGDLTTQSMSFFRFWAHLTFNCFTLVLVLSPVYLNLTNLLRIFGWFGAWNSQELNVDSSYSDALTILVVKFGLIPGILLLPAIAASLWALYGWVKERPGAFSKSFYFLLLCVGALHLSIISFLVDLNLPWHGLGVFPFLFLPFLSLWKLLRERSSSAVKALLVVILVAVPADNMYRYLYWYPYGHLDGAQYGENYIGVNRPCLISFEAIPEVYAHISRMATKQGLRRFNVHVHASESGILNRYITAVLTTYAQSRGRKDIAFRNARSAENRAHVIITSPISAADTEQRLRKHRYRRLRTISVAGIAAATLWEGKGLTKLAHRDGNTPSTDN